MIRTMYINQEPEYDESDINYKWTKTVVSLQAQINPAIPPAQGGEDAAAQITKRIRSCLWTPRQKLTLSYAGPSGQDIYLESPAPGKSIDANNGPKVRHVNVTHIGGSQTWMVEFVVETCLNECCGGTPNPNLYVSRRWSESQELDERFLCTRTIRGVIWTRSDLGIDSGALSQFVVGAGVPPGFERQSAHYTKQLDGMALSWEYVDKESMRVAPAPAIKWTGEINTSTTNLSGEMFAVEAVVTMYGHKYSGKAAMIRRAAIIALGRLFPDQPPGNGVFVPRAAGTIVNGGIRESLHDNVIELRVKALMRTRAQTALGFLNAQGDTTFPWDTVRGIDAAPLAINYQQTPKGQQNSQFPGKYREVTILGAWLAQSIIDPCLQTTVTPIQSIGNPDDTPPDTISAEIDMVDSLDLEETDWDDEELQGGGYPFYSLDTQYITDPHTWQLPLASSTGATCVFASTARPTMMKVVSFTAQRVGQQPTIPDPDVVDTNNVLLGKQIGIPNVQLMPDGETQCWMIQGVYVYGVVDADEEDLASGRVPYIDVDDSELVLQGSIFSDDLV